MLFFRVLYNYTCNIPPQNPTHLLRHLIRSNLAQVVGFGTKLTSYRP